MFSPYLIVFTIFYNVDNVVYVGQKKKNKKGYVATCAYDNVRCLLFSVWLDDVDFVQFPCAPVVY